MTDTRARDEISEEKQQQRGRSFRLPGYGLLLPVVSLVGAVVLWQVVATLVDRPVFLPSPLAVWEESFVLWDRGILQESILISFMRIFSGWVIGSLIGVPLGLLMGRSRIVRALTDPYVEFFRFVPPIAFLTLAVTWFGLGEASKIVLIVWTTLFMVAISTMIGFFNVDAPKVEAARSLGASEFFVFRRVQLPASVPHIVSGMKIAMGNSFMTVVAAEMIAANAGVGWLIFDSRLYLKTDWIFIGILALGTMGFVTDRLFRLFAGRLLHKYNVKF